MIFWSVEMGLRDEWFMKGSYGDYVVVRRFDASREEREKAVRASEAADSARSWLRDPFCRPTLLRLFETIAPHVWSGDGETEYERERIIARRLMEAFQRGDLVMLKVRDLPVVTSIVAVEPDEVTLAPAPEAPRALEDFIEVLLFDSTGLPMPSDLDKMGVTFAVTLVGERKAAPGPTPMANGRGEIRSISGNPPSACSITFAGLDDFSDKVPTDASRALPPDPSLLTSRRGAPVLDVKAFTRRELAKQRQDGVLDAANVFQLRRRKAEVIELEHFSQGGAIFLPGDAPKEIYRSALIRRPQGIDVLRECLTFAQDFSVGQIVITGHDANVSQQRADCVRLLLVGDLDSRHDWIALAGANATSVDHDAILTWAHLFFTPLDPAAPWDCDPSGNEPRDGSPRASVEGFQRAYNRDVFAGKFPTAPILPSGDPQTIRPSGVVGVDTYGAMFDCYMRALRPAPTPAAAPPSWAIYDEGKLATRTGANAERPQAVHPFVLLGTNGPGNAPITLAKHGSGSENNYMDLHPLNPQYRIGVDPEFIGQTLNVPDIWAGHLATAGYTIQRDPLPMPPAAAQPGPPPVAPPGPVATACGSHHLTTPFATADRRRALRRNVEVAFLELAALPPRCECGPGSGACIALNCELYDPREFALVYTSGRAPKRATFRIRDSATGNPIPLARVTVRCPDGSVVALTTDTDGTADLEGQDGDVFRVVAVSAPAGDTHIVRSQLG